MFFVGLVIGKVIFVAVSISIDDSIFTSILLLTIASMISIVSIRIGILELIVWIFVAAGIAKPRLRSTLGIAFRL